MSDHARPRVSIVTTLLVVVLAAVLVVPLTACSRPWRLIDTAKTKLPDPVAKWLESYRTIEVGTSFTHETYTYLLVSWGVKDTGLYQVQITNVDLSGSEVVVRTKWTQPAAFAAVDPHYPHALARIKRTDKPVKFVAEGGAPEWIPSLVGVPAAFRIYQPSQGVMYTPNKTDSVEFGRIFVGSSGVQPAAGQVAIEGIGRVFEGTVEYDFMPDGGEPFGHGFVTASSGGPDWGYFVISVAEPSPLPRYLRVYSTSAEDGRIQDLVMVDLTLPPK